jgi:hypothetical protein
MGSSVGSRATTMGCRDIARRARTPGTLAVRNLRGDALLHGPGRGDRRFPRVALTLTNQRRLPTACASIAASRLRPDCGRSVRFHRTCMPISYRLRGADVWSVPRLVEGPCHGRNTSAGQPYSNWFSAQPRPPPEILSPCPLRLWRGHHTSDISPNGEPLMAAWRAEEETSRLYGGKPNRASTGQQNTVCG